MPKVVDHDQRRRELAHAVWQVVREHGLEGASVRAVARQAGWSHSSVQYYFSTQAELLTFAMRTIDEQAAERLAGLELPDDPLESTLILLETLLPVDLDARTATELWAAFLSRVLVDRTAREINTGMNERLAELLRELLERLAANHWMPPDTDLDLEVTRLHAFFDGIALHAVTDPSRMPPDRIRSLLRRHFEQLLQPAPALPQSPIAETRGAEGLSV
ncbi:TetR/AcrR family transcriptional regulator [Nocardia sp. NPDC004722]